jgi:hypothetical protein
MKFVIVPVFLFAGVTSLSFLAFYLNGSPGVQIVASGGCGTMVEHGVWDGRIPLSSNTSVTFRQKLPIPKGMMESVEIWTTKGNFSISTWICPNLSSTTCCLGKGAEECCPHPLNMLDSKEIARLDVLARKFVQC